MDEHNGDDHLYIPYVMDEKKPKIGMIFPTTDDAFSFYNQYAREAGFSARISNSKKDKVTKELVWKQFVCFKEGYIDEVSGNKLAKDDESRKERSRGTVRTGCKARISIVKAQDGSSWVVSALKESHNHPLTTPSKVHLLRSHRNVSAAKKALIQQFAEVNVPTCQQMRLLEIIGYGGPANIGCTETDIRNFERGLKEDQKGTDAKRLIEFFESEKEKSSGFFFECDTDSEKRLTRCFWADPVSRIAYSRFNRALINQWHKELLADHVDVNEKPKIKTQLPMEHQMAKIYTRKKWTEFESEISESHSYCVQQVSSELELLRYNVSHFQSSSSRPRVITHNKKKDYVSCSCLKFNFEGIPCRHMLAYFRFAQVFQLPEQYIMKRWTQDAKIGAKYAMSEENINNNPEKFLLTRHSQLSFATSLLADDASLTDATTKFVLEQVQSIHRKVKEMHNNSGVSIINKNKRAAGGDHVIMDPPIVRAKGCGERLKQSKERSTSKSRLCNGCGLRGVSHDKRNCPKLQDGPNTENSYDGDGSTDEEYVGSIADGSNITGTTGSHLDR